MRILFPYRLASLLAIFLLSGCATSSIVEPQDTAKLTPVTQSYRDLLALPEPVGRITVAVYGVRDQTGQFKPAPESSFSTAITQGASAMLVKVLRDSKWFMPVERENLQNLLTERKIIRALEVPAEKDKPAASVNLPPLTPAHLIIEGGVVGYESNVKSGGFGVRYFGIGFSSQYRMDQVTVNLRIVDVRSGQILASVMTTKSIYSYEYQPSVYRFVKFKHLLEMETGFATNEPAELCVQDAIESAVIHLIAQGIKENLWKLKNPEDFNGKLLQSYLKEQQFQTSPVPPQSGKL